MCDLFRGIRVVSAVGRFGRVVSAKFLESIRPILVVRFGRESFRPLVISAHVGGGGALHKYHWTQHLLFTH